jgi:hypothetical protein
MLPHENGESCGKKFSQWPLPARIAAIAAAVVVLVPSFLVLCGAVTMWLWNWLMPALFKLPPIGFWQAVGILLLSHILFKGGHFRNAGSSRWKKPGEREPMRLEGAEAKAE